MLDEVKKIGISYHIITILICLAALVLCIRGCRSDDNIKGTISTITDNNERAGASVESARSEVSNAIIDTAGAIERIENSTTIINENARTIDECRELVARCQEYNQRAKQILGSIEQPNKNTT